MIEPPPAFSIGGSSARVTRYIARTLRSNEKSKASSSHSRIVPAWT